jgi:mersacidin/lichenicidin family type 2 lantibiotic
VLDPEVIAAWTDPVARAGLELESGSGAQPQPENPAGTIVLVDVLDD